MLLNKERVALDGIAPEAKNSSETMPQAGEAGIGFLFGSERFGMANEDVYRCHVALSIPTNPGFGSLNLGAAIQVIAYEWRQALGGFGVAQAAPERLLADAGQVAASSTRPRPKSSCRGSTSFSTARNWRPKKSTSCAVLPRP